jgi:predicted metal-dependent enzyme (double-stranded beta helix superfamily)
MSSDLGETADWPPEGDGVAAAPNNHRVLLENENMRVLEVTLQPGERENVHHHQWPSVMVIDSRPNYVNYDKDGNIIRPAIEVSANPEMPIVARLPPQAAHSVLNTGSTPFHAIRIEYKHPPKPQ